MLPVRILEIKDSDDFPKTGRAVAYYDRYEVEQHIDGDINENNLRVWYTYQAWKDSQRYTVHVKEVGVRADGSLDWSEY